MKTQAKNLMQDQVIVRNGERLLVTFIAEVRNVVHVTVLSGRGILKTFSMNRMAVVTLD